MKTPENSLIPFGCNTSPALVCDSAGGGDERLKAPDDLLTMPTRQNSCDVYWGSHGCHRPKGHSGDCWCDCCECGEVHPNPGLDYRCVAGPPYYGSRTVFYGDDAEGRGLNTIYDPVIGPCAKCGETRREDTPDPCLGRLPEVWSACCGHGDASGAYVATENHGTLYGEDAVRYFEAARATS